VTEISSAARRQFPICILGSDRDEGETTATRLRESGFSTHTTPTPEDVLEKIRHGACRVVIAHLNMSAADDLEFLENVARLDPGVYAIVVTPDYAVDAAIEALKRGAYDFLKKPIDFTRLGRTLDELAGIFAKRTHVRYLEEMLLRDFQFRGIVGKSPAILEVLDLARRVARHYSNVLITGPTGSGKELVARALHELSPVAQGRFVVCNCSALVDTLLESQLFGHLRGSFTGAIDNREGLLQYADGGTVFLDEITETSIQVQAKLLRVIQNREIQRVGSPVMKKINVRLIAASNRDVREEVQAGRFREDLFYRLSAVEIRVPSLAERAEDITLLINHFLEKYNQSYAKSILGLTRRAQMALFRHHWPGNVRELENVIAGAALTAAADFIDLPDLPEHLRSPRLPTDPTESWRLEHWRRAHILRVLGMCNGNRLRAAQMLGIGKTTLYRFLAQNGRVENTAPPGSQLTVGRSRSASAGHGGTGQE
jgi:DNA-binding NtrC family response regulator